MSNTYELTVVYPPSLTEVKQKKALKEVEDLVKKQKGKVVSKDHWGKKPLAYLIKKQFEGFYGHWLVELPSTALTNISRELRLDEKLMRYLFVKVKEQKIKKSKK